MDLLYFAQDAKEISSQYLRNLGFSFLNEQYMRKIVLLSPMCNICTKFAQDCTSFLNSQYRRKICARFYLRPQCSIFAEDCTSLPMCSKG